MPRVCRRLLVISAVSLLWSWPAGAICQDTLWVNVAAEPAWGAGTHLVEDLRLGSIDGPAGTTFGIIVGLGLFDDLGFLIADRQGPTIGRYSADGAFLGAVGGVGQGPGEFRQPIALAVSPGNEIAVWDPGNTRVTWIRPDGSYSRSIRVASGLITSEPLQIDTGGVVYVKTGAPGARPQAGVGMSMIWLKLPGVLGSVDSIAVPRKSSQGASFTRRSQGRDLVPFRFERLSALSRYADLWVGTNTRYAIFRTMNDGRILAVGRDERRISLTGGEYDDWEAILAYSERRTGSSFGQIPRRKPFFHTLATDDDGRLWVGLYRTAARYPRAEQLTDNGTGRPPLTWLEPNTWDVFERSGRYLGRLDLPASGRLIAARGTTVWVIEEGEFGEQYVVRYGITTRP